MSALWSHFHIPRAPAIYISAVEEIAMFLAALFLLLCFFPFLVSLASIESAIRRGKLCQSRPVLSLVTLQLHRQRAISYPEIAIGCN